MPSGPDPACLARESLPDVPNLGCIRRTNTRRALLGLIPEERSVWRRKRCAIRSAWLQRPGHTAPPGYWTCGSGDDITADPPWRGLFRGIPGVRYPAPEPLE